MLQHIGFTRTTLFFAMIATMFISSAAALASERYNCAKPLSLISGNTVHRKSKNCSNSTTYTISSTPALGTLLIFPPNPKNPVVTHRNGSISLKYRLTVGSEDMDHVLWTYNAGAWFSIRREFDQPVDLSSADGIEIVLTAVNSESGVSLFVIINKHWISKPIGGPGIFVNKKLIEGNYLPGLNMAGSSIINIPFSEFEHESARLGSDKRLNTKQISSYEFRLVGDANMKISFDKVSCY